MKRFYLIALVLAVALSSCDNLLNDDDDDDRRGVTTATVKDLSGLRDDTHVRLTGSVTKKVPDTYERYEFKDDTGTVEVEIERKVWRRGLFDPANLNLPVDVEIIGEMDKERGGWLEIDADRIIKREK